MKLTTIQCNIGQSEISKFTKIKVNNNNIMVSKLIGYVWYEAI
jgi:hypothetical protein